MMSGLNPKQVDIFLNVFREYCAYKFHLKYLLANLVGLCVFLGPILNGSVQFYGPISMLLRTIFWLEWPRCLWVIKSASHRKQENIEHDKILKQVKSPNWHGLFSWISLWIILRMCPANERQHYIVMLSLIGWAHTQNDPCICTCNTTYCYVMWYWYMSSWRFCQQHITFQRYKYQSRQMLWM